MSMLVLLLAVAVGCREAAAVSYLTELEQYQKKFEEEWLPECLAVSKAPADTMKSNLYPGNNATQEVKCCVECLYEKEGIIVDGAVVVGKMSEIARKLKMPELEAVLDAAKKCDDEVPPSSEKCQTGIRLSECFRKYHKL